MKKIILLFFLLSGIYVTAQIKLGSNPATIGGSSLLELESANKALVVSRVANTAAITTPVNGMIIYDNSLGCIRVYQNGSWSSCFGANVSSNGSALLASVNCGTAPTYSFVAGVPVGNVTQTITVDVSAVGSYDIKAVSNGVTFSGSGIFTGTNYQTLVLTASGTPIEDGTTVFNLNTIPSCSFNVTVNNASSNGTAVISSYTCSTGSAGNLLVGAVVSGVTQTITAAVTRVGTYSISASLNGVVYSGSGTFTQAGNQNVVLTASGTPTTAGTNTFTLNTTPNCSFTKTVSQPSTNGTAVVSSYTSTASAGTITAGTAVSGVTQTITANVTTDGTYAISGVTNGVTFSGSGTFGGTGNRAIVLTATGTAVASGTSSFTLNTTPNCSFTRTVASGSSSLCTTIVDTFPATQTIGGSSVTITTPDINTSIGSFDPPTQCDLSPSGNVIGLQGGGSNAEYVQYSFTSPLKNVQLFSANNEFAGGDNLYVTATVGANFDPVSIQLVPVTGGSCNSSFAYNAIPYGSGYLGVNSGVTSQSAVIFTLSSTSAYDTITVTRIGGSGQNSVGLMLCNATLGP
jgi:hypothetical protein